MESILFLLGLLVLGSMAAGWAGLIMALDLRRRLRALESRISDASARPGPSPGPQPAAEPASPRSQPRPAPARAAKPAQSRSVKRIEPMPSGAGGEGAAGKSRKEADKEADRQSELSQFFEALERSLAGNWLVWVAGLALALGGLFLARYAFEQGFLGPVARVVLIALVGGAMIAAGEFLRRRPDIHAAVPSLAAPVLAAAGVITLYGDIYAAYAAFDLIPGGLAFAGLALIAALALGLAWLHGPVIAAFGITGAFIAPALIGSNDPNAASLFVYVYGVTAASLAVARFARWRWTAWLSLAGGAGWPLLWLTAGFDASQALALSLYLPAYAATAIAFAWEEAETPFDFTAVRKAGAAAPPVSVLAAYAALFASLLLGLMLAARWDYETPSVIPLCAISALAMAAAWRREGFALAPVIAGLAAAALLYLWPGYLAHLSVTPEAMARVPAQIEINPAPCLTVGLGLMALFGIGGWLALGRLRLKGPMASVSAAAPAVALTLMAVKMIYLAPDYLWSLALFLAAATQIGLVELRLQQDRGNRHPGPPAAYALGAAASVLCGLALSLSEAWLGAALGLETLAVAWLWRRWSLPALSWAAAIGALATAYQLTLGADYLLGDISGLSGSISLILAYAVAAAALQAAAWTMRGGDARREGGAVRTLEGSAIALGVLALFFMLRLALNGDLQASYDNLMELGLQSSLWLALAFALRWRLGGGLTTVQRVAETGLVAMAGVQIALLHLVIRNPALEDGLPVYGPPVFNPLLLAYALPALLTGALAWLWRRRGFSAAHPAALASAFLFFVWATLEVRRAFHAPDLSGGRITDAESWAYSLCWLLVGGLFMAAGIIRRLPILRYAALAVLVVATIKVFLFDLAGLGGVWRALSFLGLGAALMTIALVYQRVLRPGEETPDAGQALR